MSRTLQFKRYANTTVANTVGAAGELIIDSTNNTITVHDSVTYGGTRIATETYANNAAISAMANSNFTQSAYNQANSSYTIATQKGQNSQSNNYILQYSDTTRYIYYKQLSSNVNIYIPTSGNVSWQNGQSIMVVLKNSPGNTITITPNTGVLLYTPSNTISGIRTITTQGMVTLFVADQAANTWFMTTQN